MRKLCAVFAIILILTAGKSIEAADFTPEQVDKIFDITIQKGVDVENSALPFDTATFQMNFNAFMTDFISSVSNGEDFAAMQNALLINNPIISPRNEGTVFAKNFFNRVAVVGLSDVDGKLKVLNFFATQPEGRDDSLYHVLILQAFVKGISPDYDATTLLNDLKKNSTVIRNGVRYTISKDGDLNIVTVKSNASFRD